jgi:hypothetical protein
MMMACPCLAMRRESASIAPPRTSPLASDTSTDRHSVSRLRRLGDSAAQRFKGVEEGRVSSAGGRSGHKGGETDSPSNPCRVMEAHE